jgi:hypothetical protein
MPFSNSFTFSVLLPYGFTPIDDFVLRHMLNRDGIYALPAEHLYKFFPLGDMLGIHSRICCPDFLYSQLGMPPMFSGPA